MLIAPHFFALTNIAAMPWILCASWLCFTVSIINHNHMHCRMFRHNALNLTTNMALSLARGHTATGIVVPHHFNHHIEAGSDKDWIRPALAGTGLGWVRLPRYVVMASVTMMIQRLQPGAPALGYRYLSSLRLEKIFLFIAIAVAVLHDWRIFLLFNVIPWMLGLTLLVGVNLLQHDACSPTTPLGESRNFTGMVGNWFFFNNGYHTAHHLRPSAHWCELPKLHATLRSSLPSADLEQHSIFAYLWKYLWSHNAVPSNT